jgi:hypothetical protein
MEVTHGVVPEPSATLLSVAISHGKSPYVRAAINAKADVLEWEYRYRRISPIAYAAGNTYLGILREAYSSELRALPLEPSPHVSPDGWQGMLRMERAMRVNAVRQDAIKALGKEAVGIIEEVFGLGQAESAHLGLREIAAAKGLAHRDQVQFCRDFRRLSKTWPCIGGQQIGRGLHRVWIAAPRGIDLRNA